MWVRKEIAGSTTSAASGRVRTVYLFLLLAAALSFALPADAAFAATESQAGPQPGTGSTAVLEAQKANSRCLACHSRPRFKTLGDGEKLSLEVPRQGYQHSAHGGMSCVSCHTGIAKRRHPIEKITIASRREFSLQMNESCHNCHADKFTQYKTSIHASLVAEGDNNAPVCSDCHGAHTVETMAVYQPVTGQPCKQCHEDIYQAYSGSVHGLARKNGNVIRAAHVQAPICADCHTAHAVTAPASNGHLKSACTGCHEDVASKHDKWLPNAGLHLEAVSCPACHSPVAERRVDLELQESPAQRSADARDESGSFQQRLLAMEGPGKSVDPIELWNLVRRSTKLGQSTEVTLRGRLEVVSGPEAHRLASSMTAVRDCTSCHRAGAEAFQNVVVSIRRPDGRNIHYRANKDTLNSVTSVESVGDFYALGGTRIKLLDHLLVFALVGGLAVPLGHFTAGRIIRKKRNKGKGEK